MLSINQTMTIKQLTKILSDEFGMEVPTKATKAEIIDLLEENGAVLSGEVANVSINKNRMYKINILKEKGNKGAVTGCVNGKGFALPRGKDIEIKESIYKILTEGAQQIIGEPMEGGGLDTYSRPAYPVTTLSRPE